MKVKTLLTIAGGAGLVALACKASSSPTTVGALPALGQAPTQTVAVLKPSPGLARVKVPANASVVNFLSVVKGAGGVDVFNPAVEIAFLSDPSNVASIVAFLTGKQLLERYQGRVLLPNGTKGITISNPSQLAPLACTVVFELR